MPRGSSALCLLLASLLVSSSCPPRAGARSNRENRRESRQEKSDGIEFPTGLDDAVIDRVKNGQPVQKVLAVLDFEGNEKLRDKVDLKMSEMLTTSLVQTGRFTLVERNEIDQAIREQKLGMVGVIDAATAAEMGKILGAEYIVLGSITSVAKNRIDKFGYVLVEVRVAVDVRAVNSTTGRILLSEAAEGLSASKEIRTADGTLVQGALEDEAAFSAAARDAVEKVSHRIAALSPLLGYVVLVDKEEVTIDLGEEKGVAAGDRFVVFRIKEEIVHPVTGKHIGWQKEILQEIEIERTERQMSAGRVVKVEDPAGARPGDLVISR